jgi:hypothetical protein
MFDPDVDAREQERAEKNGTLKRVTEIGFDMSDEFQSIVHNRVLETVCGDADAAIKNASETGFNLKNHIDAQISSHILKGVSAVVFDK